MKNVKTERDLYLVRHGDASFFNSDYERVLASLGEAQAKAAGTFLAQELKRRFENLTQENAQDSNIQVTSTLAPAKAEVFGAGHVLVRTSGYKRAEQTAFFIESVLKAKLGPAVKITHEVDANLAPSGNYVVEKEFLEYASDTLPEVVIVVTHMPFVAELAWTLGDREVRGFANCEVATFEGLTPNKNGPTTYEPSKHWLPA